MEPNPRTTAGPESPDSDHTYWVKQLGTFRQIQIHLHGQCVRIFYSFTLWNNCFKPS